MITQIAIFTIQFLTGQIRLQQGSCPSTVFGHADDKWKGGKALYLKREVNAEDLGVAHRSLPLGTYVILQNKNKVAVTQVIDRGPYGAIVPDEEFSEDRKCRVLKSGKVWCLKLKKEDPGEWRGCLDITPAAGKAIGHKGKQTVKYWVVR